MIARRMCGALLVLVLAGCSTNGPGDDGEPASPDADATAPSPSSSESAPAEPTWGPSATDVSRARELVVDWDADRIAGQLMVAGYAGTDPATPARLLRDLHLAGIKIGGFNVASSGQVRETTRAVVAATREDGRRFPPVLAVDQEGGTVEHLRGAATSFPPFAASGRMIERDPKRGPGVVRDALGTAALEMRSLGVTWVLGPVADVTIGAADPTIGSRAASSDPRLAARTTVAALRGYRDAALVSAVKHYPGHGAVTTDSHVALPRLDADRSLLERRELVPFRAAVEAGAPAVMMGHLDVRALAPGQPASLAPEIYRHLRRDLGFDGVTITDALEMDAVARPGVALRALRAGADLVLMPDDPRASHARIAGAIRAGELPRDRALRSAERVVALQLWQQRRARAVPVPDDVTAHARAASSRLAN